MNIRDFAKICGCTHTTVSCAFSRPEKLREETLRRIMALAEEHNFRPNRAGGASFSGVTKTIGVLNYSGSYFTDITKGIQAALLGNAYLPIMLTTGWDERLELVRRLVDQRVDGIIMIDPRRELSPKEIREFQTKNIPRVLIEPPAETKEDWVNTDDYAGGIMAAEHFLRLRHKRFAVIRNLTMERDNMAPPRTRGFVDRLEKENLSPIHIRGTGELKKRLVVKNRPTAIFLETDEPAPEVYDIANEVGLTIPEDISVIGYADLGFCDKIRPALTTIRQDGLAVGRQAVELMLKRLKNRDAPPCHVYIPVRLIERDSTATTPKKVKPGGMSK